MIRDATPADAVAIAALDAECFPGSAWSLAAWEGEFSQRRIRLVGGNDQVLSVLSVSVVGSQAELLRIAVSRDARRRGMAKELIAEAARRATESGCETWFLEVEDDNVPAISLYESLGFTPLATRSNYYGPGRDCLVMSCSGGPRV